MKGTGFFVLHCDHMQAIDLRIVLDDIFGEKKFSGSCYLEEPKQSFYACGNKDFQNSVSHIHDSLFFFSKSNLKKLNKQYISQEGMKEI